MFFRVDSYGRRERERQKKIREEETRARLLKEKREMREEYLSEFLEARLRLKPVPKVVIPELTDVSCSKLCSQIDVSNKLKSSVMLCENDLR